MKKIIIILFILFSKISFGIANTNIVFLDMNKIMTTSKPGASILKQLNKKNNQTLKSFKNDEKNLKDKETKLLSQKNILSEKEFLSNIDKLKIEISDYNKNRKIFINDINKLKNKNEKKLLIMVNSILIKYSDEKSISMIFPKKNLVIGKSDLDVTDEIIKIINTEIKEFKIE
tara:strand:+ start:630 stop:1148 length:519 start_codon:yes stop_codon:yes gene_type:complete